MTAIVGDAIFHYNNNHDDFAFLCCFMLYHPDINVLIWGGLSEKVKIGYYTSDLSKSSSSFRQESSLYIVMTER